MQKAFEKIVEKMKEEKASYYLTIANTGDEKLDAIYKAVGNAIDNDIKIVNQVAEEYSHRNSDLVIDSSHRIEGLDDVINRLQYKADNIKAKLEPSYFTECIDYLKSLPRCDDGWIPCEEKPFPDELNKYYDVTYYHRGMEETFSRMSYFFTSENGDPVWEAEELNKFIKVIAWKERAKPYQPKGE